MKRTYTSTIGRPDLTRATVIVNSYRENKYTGNVEDDQEERFTGLIAWDIIEGGYDAEEVERRLPPEEYDPEHEYLILRFKDGTAKTYKNSYTDMFII